MRGGCPTHATRSNEYGADTNALNWATALSGQSQGGAVVSSDGTIYIGTDRGGLYKLTPQGGIAASASIGAVLGTPAIAADGTIYVGTSTAKLYALNPAKLAVKWQFAVVGAIASSPAVGGDGSIYIGTDDGVLYAVTSSGALKWKFRLSSVVGIRSSPAVGREGDIYFGGQDGIFYALHPDGTEKWRRYFSTAVASSPVVGRFGQVYVGAEGSLWALESATGSTRWSFAGCGQYGAPAVAQNGTLYCASGSSLQALTPDGTSLWRYATGQTVRSTPIVDAVGNIYFGSDDDFVYALDASGALLWKYATGGNVECPVVLAAGGAVLAPSSDNKLYSIGVGHPRAWQGGSCVEDDDCATHLICGLNLGPRFGKPAGTGVCVPPSCQNKMWDATETKTDCGGSCGECPSECTATCTLGSQVAPQGQAYMSFWNGAYSRASRATYQIGRASIEDASFDEMRWEDRGDGNGRLLLLEGERTNVVRFSEQVDRSPWGCGVANGALAACTTVSADIVTSPRGDQTADRITVGTDTTKPQQPLSKPLQGQGALSAWLRILSQRGWDPTAVPRARVVLYDATLSSYVEPNAWPVAAGWARRTASTLPMTAPTRLALSNEGAWPGDLNTFPDLGSVDMVGWGWQLEAGAFASSYIPTTEESYTRKADRLVFEAQRVASWIYTGMWQFEVYPEHASSIVPDGSEFVILAGDFGQLSLTKTGGAGALIMRNGATLAKLPFEWAYNERLWFTVDNISTTLSVRRTDGRVDQLAFGPSSMAPGMLVFGSAVDGTRSAFARMSEPRMVAVASVDCKPDPTCTICGDGIVSATEQCDPAKTAFCDASCTYDWDFQPCASDSDCPAGQRCPAYDNGPGLGATSRRVCAPAVCATSAVMQYCGSAPDPRCGPCPCTPSCAGKTCGSNLSDGCGGTCDGVCTSGQVCGSNTDCAGGGLCVVGGVKAYNPAAAATARGCMPEGCGAPEDALLSCGSASSDCGLCTQCVPNCNGKVCGASDGCGGTCDTQSCDADSTCVAGACVKRLRQPHPTLGAQPDDSPTSNVGELDGAFVVTDRGTASYRIPIPVPPGRAGMQPSLALVYDSAGGDGYIGKGWHLEGLSVVHRCPRTYAIDGYAKGVESADGVDAFCLDGERLVPSTTANVFTTELDSFVRVTYDGRTRTFAALRLQSGEMRIYREAAKDSGVWLLSTVIDKARNAWTVAYDSNIREGYPAGHIVYRPKQIVYTKHLATDLKTVERSGTNRVEFNYLPEAADEPCRTIGQYGRTVYICHRLQSVYTFSAEGVVSGIELLRDSLDRLTQVYRLGAGVNGTVLLPGTSFDYFRSRREYDVRGGELLPGLHRFEEYGTYVGDFDGDGVSDLLAYDDEQEALALLRHMNTTTGKFETSTDTRVSALSPISTYVADIDADGRDDLIRLSPNRYTAWPPLALSWNGRAFVKTHALDFLYASDLPRFADLDGNGTTDILACNRDPDGAHPVVRVILQNTDGTFKTISSDALVGKYHPGSSPKYFAEYCGYTHLADLDGDGVQDALVLNAQGLIELWRAVKGTSGPVVEKTTLSTLPKDSDPIVGDFDGDALADVAYMLVHSRNGDRETRLTVFHNRGALTFEDAPSIHLPENFYGATAADFDGDGRDDVLGLTPAGPAYIIEPDNDDEGFGSAERVDLDTVGDFDGDGVVDALLLATDLSSQRGWAAKHFMTYVRVPGARTAGLLHTVTTGLGKFYEARYDDSAFAAESCPADGCPAYQHSQKVAPWPVVRWYQAPNGQEFTYRYTGSFTNPQRGSWLGFSSRQVTVDYSPGFQDNLETTTTTFDLQYNATLRMHTFAGRPKTHTVETTRKSTYLTTLPPVPGTNPPGIDSEKVVSTFAWKTKASYAGRSYVYLDTSDVQTFVGHTTTSSTPEARVVTTYEVDDRGNNVATYTNHYEGATRVASRTVTSTYYTLAESNGRTGDVKTLAESGCSLLFNEAASTWDWTCGATSQTKTLTYDARGYVASISEATQAGDLLTTYHNDDLGNLDSIQVTQPDRPMYTVTMSYDDVSKTYVSLTWDDENRKVETHFDQRFGVLVAQRALGGPTTSYAYDGFGRLGRIYHADGTESQIDIRKPTISNRAADPDEYKVDAVLEVSTAQHIDPNGKNLGLTITQSDALGRAVRVAGSGFGRTAVARELHYDARGLVVAETRPHSVGDTSQGVIRYEYDDAGRLTGIVRPGTSALRYVHASLSLLAPQFADDIRSFGHWPSMHPAAAYIATQLGAASGQSWAITDRMGRPLVTADRVGSNSYEYEGHGQPARVFNALGQKWTTTYDAAGRMLTQTTPDGNNRTQTYYADGQVRTSKLSGVATYTYAYDAFGRISTVDTPEGVVTYTWDQDVRAGTTVSAPGEIMKIAIAGGASVAYAYDSVGNVTQVTRGVSLPGVGTRSLTTGFEYQYGKLTSITYPGSLVDVPYKVTYGYDDNGRLISARDPERTLWRWDHAYQGMLPDVERFGNEERRTKYDDETGALLSSVSTVGSQSVFVSYAYNELGQVVQRDISGDGGHEEFTYDDAGRLKAVLWNDGKSLTQREVFTHDALGNLQTANAASYGYVYESTNPTLAKNALLTLGANGYGYDSAGRQTARSGPDVEGGSQVLEYTSSNLPRRFVVGSDAAETWLSYGPNGDRVAKVSLDATTLYAGRAYEESTALGGNVAQPKERVFRVFIPGQASPIAEVRVDTATGRRERRFLPADGLGSTLFSSNGDGVLGKVYRFSAFGKPDAVAENASEAWYAGHPRDVDLGLVNMRGRIYDSAQGRFLAPDPFVSDPTDSQGFAQYAYVRNNPLGFIDPSGFRCDGNSQQDCDSASGPLAVIVSWLACTFGGCDDGSSDGGNTDAQPCPYVDGCGPKPTPSPRPHVVVTDEFVPIDSASASVSQGGPQSWQAQFMDSGARHISDVGLGPARAFASVGAAIGVAWGVVTAYLGTLAAGALESAPAVSEALAGMNGYTVTAAGAAGAGVAARGAAAATTRGTTVLGHYPEYVEKAAELGARRFSIPTEVWNKMSAAEQWAANTKFLDRMIARGDNVVLATQAGAARAGSFFARELEYLASKGYQVAEDGWSMIAPGR